MEHLSQHEIGTFRVSCIASRYEETLRTDLERAGFACYWLDSHCITDKESFLKELSRGCGLSVDPAIKLTSWDATADLLWQGLMEQPKNKVAIIWRNANVMLDGKLQLLLDCLEFLQGVAETVEKQEVTVDCHPVLVRVVLMGDGPNFSVWK